MKLRSCLLCLFVSVIFSCSDKPFEKTRITLHHPAGTGADVVLSTYHPFNLEQNILAKTAINENGTVTIELELRATSFINYKVGGYYGTLLLEPGDNLTMTLPEKKFSGEGRQANEFIARSRTITSRYEVRNEIYFTGFTPLQFQERMDSFAVDLKQLRDGFLDTASLSGRSEKLLTALHKFTLLTHYQMYARVNDLDKIRSVALQSLREKAVEIPIDEEVADAYMLEYGTALQLYGDLAITRSITRQMSPGQNAKPDAVVKRVAAALLHGGLYPSAVNELYMAKTIDNGILADGITPLMDSLFFVYKKDFPESPYTALIQKRYDKWTALAPGKAAPDFYGTTVAGDTVTLKSLRGKIVYIDVWATWCMPCLAEFPYSIQLRQKFEASGNITFMYVSIDTNRSAWEKFITTNPNFTGVHLIDQSSSLSEPYMLQGVPRYILIDSAGNIVDANAPSPSSRVLETMLQQMSGI